MLPPTKTAHSCEVRLATEACTVFHGLIRVLRAQGREHPHKYVSMLVWLSRIPDGISRFLYLTCPSGVRFHSWHARSPHIQVNGGTFGHFRLWRIPGI